MLHKQELNLPPLLIPLIKPKHQKELKDNGDTECKYVKVEVPLDKAKLNDKKTKWKIPTFESGDAKKFGSNGVSSTTRW